MSMMRQIVLLVVAVLALAVGGSLAVSLWSTRTVLQQQWQLRNADSAMLLALALSQHRGDAVLMDIVLAAQFDTGHYRRVSLVGPGGGILFERSAPVQPGDAPAWLARVIPMSAPAGVGIVSDGWRSVGQVQVESQSTWVYDSLWAALVRAVGLMLLLGLVAIALAATAVRRWGRGLDSAVQQAQALEQGRFTEVPVPATPELARLAKGMNAMVRHVHLMFDGQTAQLDALRRQVQTDALTGLANRRYFCAQLERALGAPGDGEPPAGVDAPRCGGLLLVRLCDLAALNKRVGHAGVDGILAAMGGVLSAYPSRVEGAFAGRLNGGDLALYLPANGIGQETALAMRATLSTAIAALDAQADVAVGGVDGLTPGSISVALARADEALAQAEITGPFGVEVRRLPYGEAVGETEWRQRIGLALSAGRVRLAEYPVVDAAGRELHLECPLRVQLQPDGPYDVALRWLPMAARSRIMHRVDLTAASLALDAIARDQRARCVHLSATSLADADFVRELTARLAAQPAAAARLSLEVGEAAALHWSRWRDAAQRWRPLGVRLGLENTGGTLATLMQARSHGLDYLKIDGRFVRGLADDAALAQYAQQILSMARSIGVAVYAEGVDDARDLARLWAMGFDGATGPAVKALS